MENKNPVAYMCNLKFENKVFKCPILSFSEVTQDYELMDAIIEVNPKFSMNQLCIYACMYVCMYVCMGACMCMYVYVGMYKILLLAYKCLHGTAPSYLRELLKEYVPPRTLRSTSKNLLCEPRNNMKTYGDRSFSACAPELWNQLPDNIREAGSVTIFKRRLKTHLFKDVYIN